MGTNSSCHRYTSDQHLSDENSFKKNLKFTPFNFVCEKVATALAAKGYVGKFNNLLLNCAAHPTNHTGKESGSKIIPVSAGARPKAFTTRAALRPLAFLSMFFFFSIFLPLL